MSSWLEPNINTHASLAADCLCACGLGLLCIHGVTFLDAQDRLPTFHSAWGIACAAGSFGGLAIHHFLLARHLCRPEDIHLGSTSPSFNGRSTDFGQKIVHVQNHFKVRRWRRSVCGQTDIHHLSVADFLRKQRLLKVKLMSVQSFRNCV